MPLCTVTLQALTAELAHELEGARIDKINQPAPQEVIMQLHTESGNRKLLLSCNPQSARVGFTKTARENPAVPPMFCMSLRKHLANGKITSFRRMEKERAVILEVLSHDELGLSAKKTLILEIMGRNSNLILVGGDGRILDAVRKVDAEMSPKRRILPGLFYRNPPREEKMPLEDVREDTLMGLPCGSEIAGGLMEHISGLCPLIAREIAFRATGETDAVLTEENRPKVAFVLGKIRDKLQNGEGDPWVLYDREGHPRDFSFMPVTQYGEHYTAKKADSFSGLLEDFYDRKDAEAQLKQKTSLLRKTVVRAHDRVIRKLASQGEELKRTEGRERLREMADILGAYAFRIPKGAGEVSLPDLYDPEQKEVRIPLSEKLSVQQNIRRYYKEYAKMKNAAVYLAEQTESGRAERDYLESVLEELDRARTDRDIADIKEELTENRYLVSHDEGKKKKKPAGVNLKPMIFESPSGKAVLVGRNNRENDHLTLHEADRADLWFHLKNRPGSHVILFTEGQEASEEDLVFCAGLAAYYSSARESGRAEVDYTAARNVKKPAGARPGMVIYDRYKTLVVEPTDRKRQ